MNSFDYPDLKIELEPANNPQTPTRIFIDQDPLAVPDTKLQKEFHQLQHHFPDNNHWIMLSPEPTVLLSQPKNKPSSSFEWLTHARKWLDLEALSQTTLELNGGDKITQEAFICAWLARCYKPATYRSTASTAPENQTLYLATPKISRERIKALQAEAKGNALTRFLAWQPAALLTPGRYQQFAAQLSKHYNWDITVYDREKLTQMGAGAFLAVCRGDQQQSAIVHLRYRPEIIKQHIALVGKGICFDTGGYNLKKDMQGMQMDMGGSAVALGNLLAATEQQLPYQIDCFLALAENHIGPNAYKTSEVVTALNGQTIEIVDTDAEGRMVLADTLTLASREKPQLIIDYATLTGTCKRALGSNRSGLWSNQPDWLMPLLSIGDECGERIWPQPLDPDYDEDIQSDIADIAQCAAGPGPDHIHAARFLQRFISEQDRWIHIDLSSFNVKGGLAHQASPVTGFGVRYTQTLFTQLERISL
ncbi:MAG: cytosol aminopeptidase [Candidatus Celerinatantimonas neptuna]|nr:MAG: cytosol aminopeptidase [Candidatus Celerinatantimonas neptuna]